MAPAEHAPEPGSVSTPTIEPADLTPLEPADLTPPQPADASPPEPAASVAAPPPAVEPASRPMFPPARPRMPAPAIERGPRPVANAAEDGSIERTATAPQLRRFIKSRAYVPMHELRRRFVINGGDDEVTPVDLDKRRIFVGLPEREGRLLGELLRGGDIGYELSLDPISPIVVGVYPMRPVTRA